MDPRSPQHDEEAQAGPLTCANDCGFYGNVDTLNMCSVCYRKHMGVEEEDEADAKCSSPAPVVLCAKNCGFFGNPATSNLCSGCHRGSLLEQIRADGAKLLQPSEASVGSPHLAVEPEEEQQQQLQVCEEASQGSRKRKRCFLCTKRLGLVSADCRCGHAFCPSHRLAEQHDCTFDYKALGRAAIAEANPIVKRSKVDQI